MRGMMDMLIPRRRLWASERVEESVDHEMMLLMKNE